ncbi:hypothetical protein [Alkaliphilus oremlandii]|uniref:Uncharacterized protein n=1 Tax=Alkaliphilus oremlandii (strain OhILAs) TaxID=350688 RepID=A8MLS0_ALKOO|nr:hypothetical protein [Alkaliphilus oremlandii]ABW17987.1 conserved hypothetical protein [Alkaliphilus oremlandii OhILAs]
MGDFLENLIETYKHKVVPGKKSVEEIIRLLSLKLTLAEMDSTSVSQSYLDIVKCNMVHSMLNEEKKLDKESLDIVIYKVIEDERSAIYYKDIKRTNQKEIIIFCERNLEFFESNSNSLIMKIWLIQGVDFYDYNNNTWKLINYLSLLYRYETDC